MKKVLIIMVLCLLCFGCGKNNNTNIEPPVGDVEDLLETSVVNG